MTGDLMVLEPVVSWPREVELGRSYLVTVDIRSAASMDSWPYNEEQFELSCVLDGQPYLDANVIDDPVLVLHRFGGTYRPVRFVISARHLPEQDPSTEIWLSYVNRWGVILRTLPLPLTISSRQDVTTQPSNLLVRRDTQASDDLNDAERSSQADRQETKQSLRLESGEDLGDASPREPEGVTAEGWFAPLVGSERLSLRNAQTTGTLDTSERAEITVVVRRRAELPAEIVAGLTVLTNEQLAEGYGADPADVDLVRRELGGRGLEVTAVHTATRRVKVAGTLGDLSSTFGTTLTLVTSPDHAGRQVTHRYREGPLYVPAALHGVVTAVLGLDTRPQARPRFRAASYAAATQGTSYLPNQVADIYNFPAGTTGAGQTIALIELGGGFTTSDVDAYFAALGIAVPSITAVSVDGAINAPGSDPVSDVEVSLDINVIGAVAPYAAQVVYFAPNNGDQGFVDAVSDAAQASPTPVAISISWGQSEDSWTVQGLAAMNAAMSDAAALGITVCVAAGNNGSSDGVSDGQVHVDFPASSPYALGCGGTTLLADPSTGVPISEVVWNELASNEGAGGGGVSDQFALPSWQANAGVPARASRNTSGDDLASGGEHNQRSRSDPGIGRGVPDVAGNADPTTGYQIYSGGQAQVVGGTGAVAPLWAALISRFAEAMGQPFGLIQPVLYSGVAPGSDVVGFRDITEGNNGAYSAGTGWDPCTGLGVPDGETLLSRLGTSTRRA